MVRKKNLDFKNSFSENNQEKKEKRIKNKKQKCNNSFILKKIIPKTENQQKCFEYWSENNLFLHGLAGTGKTFLACYFCLSEFFNVNNTINKIYIVRSAVPIRDIGALPGDIIEKSNIYELPYIEIFNELVGRGDAYENFKKRKEVEFITTSYIRGITLNDCCIIVDECQSMTFHELDSIITRCGKNCKIIFCGDISQNDLLYKKNDISGIVEFVKIINKMPAHFKFVEFNVQDIIRSDLIKDYLLTKEKLKEE